MSYHDNTERVDAAEMFCIEGEADAAKGQYWHYSKPKGGLSEGKC